MDKAELRKHSGPYTKDYILSTAFGPNNNDFMKSKDTVGFFVE